MGIIDCFEYVENQRPIRPGQIILIGTDGIWEARNEEGLMLGKERYREMIRRHSRLSARGIVEAVMEDIERYRGGAEHEDDVTLVVVKVLE